MNLFDGHMLHPSLSDFIDRCQRHLNHDIDPAWRDFALQADGDHVHNQDLLPFVPGAEALRSAAVMICVHDVRDPKIVLTRRRDDLRAHKGQIAFPGGKADAGDLTPADTALREAQEEIALVPQNVEVLGSGPVYQSITGYRIVPVIGVLHKEQSFKAQETEVADIFSVPLAHLMTRGNFSQHTKIWQGKPRAYEAIEWQDRYIWGITAALISRLQATLYHGEA